MMMCGGWGGPCYLVCQGLITLLGMAASISGPFAFGLDFSQVLFAQPFSCFESAYITADMGHVTIEGTT